MIGGMYPFWLYDSSADAKAARRTKRRRIARTLLLATVAVGAAGVLWMLGR